jgi:hypothetical protein
MIRTAAAILLAGLALLLGAGTAWAHGGPIELAVQGDGGQGVTTTVVYTRDHHFVSEEVRMTMTAVSTDGTTVGPIAMVASAEGQSFYVSKEPLPVGTWTVTVAATHPSTATKTVAVTAAVLKPPIRTNPVTSGNSSIAVIAIVIPVALAAAALVVTVMIRRRKTAAAQ